MRHDPLTYRPLTLLSCGLLLLSSLACVPTGTQARVSYTPANERSSFSQNGEIPVYLNDSPPGDYTLIGMVTVENPDAGERNYIARKEAAARGGNALIAKAPKKEQVREVTQMVDLNQPGGFRFKSKNKVVVTQDFLIIKMEPGNSNTTPLSMMEPLSGGSYDTQSSQVQPLKREPEEEKPEPVTTPAPLPTGADFVDRGDGTVLQTKQGLLWQKCSAGTENSGGRCRGFPSRFTGDEAASFCESLNLSGRRWRLPSRDDLKGLMTNPQGSSDSQSAQSTLVDGTYFPDTPAGIFWSSDNYSDGKEIAAWVVDFSDSRDYAYYRENKGYTRCVTSAQGR